jgi:micrococcal nuclease
MRVPEPLFWSALLVAAACGRPEPTSTCGDEAGVVDNVVDGDTVDLASGVRVRYLLIDTPEIAHSADESSACYGDEAARLNGQLVLGRHVTLEYDEVCEDRYDRLLAHVYVGDRMINRELIARGCARLLVVPPNQKYADEFAQLEADAKGSRIGLWGDCQ